MYNCIIAFMKNKSVLNFSMDLDSFPTIPPSFSSSSFPTSHISPEFPPGWRNGPVDSVYWGTRRFPTSFGCSYTDSLPYHTLIT